MTGLKQVMFETASMTADWRFPYRIIVPQMGGWGPDDAVWLGMTPDVVSWNDYGRFQREFPPQSGAANDYAPWFQANSDDGSGVVVLVDPNLVDIIVPWNNIRTMGPGSVAVGVQYRNKATGRRSTLVTGRLPLSDGVI